MGTCLVSRRPFTRQGRVLWPCQLKITQQMPWRLSQETSWLLYSSKKSCLVKYRPEPLNYELQAVSKSKCKLLIQVHKELLHTYTSKQYCNENLFEFRNNENIMHKNFSCNFPYFLRLLSSLFVGVIYLASRKKWGHTLKFSFPEEEIETQIIQ